MSTNVVHWDLKSVSCADWKTDVQQMGNVEVPQEAFMAVLSIERTEE